MTTQYAFIKDGIVVNTVLFDNPSDELLEEFRLLHEVDEVVLGTINNKIATPGDTWNGTNFIFPQPFPSWVLDENDDWVAPTPMPDDEDSWWDESELTWKPRNPDPETTPQPSIEE